jgi:hypothetical protein
MAPDGVWSRIRWGNVTRLAALVALAIVVAVWPRLRGAPPRLPPATAVPLGGPSVTVAKPSPRARPAKRSRAGSGAAGAARRAERERRAARDRERRAARDRERRAARERRATAQRRAAAQRRATEQGRAVEQPRAASRVQRQQGGAKRDGAEQPRSPRGAAPGGPPPKPARASQPDPAAVEFGLP